MEDATYTENMANDAKMTSIWNKQSVLEEIENKADYLKELYEEDGIRGYMTEDVGVRYLFGKPLSTDYLINDILIGLFIAFFTGSAFAYEKKSNMYTFVKSTKNGVKSLWYGKIFWCVGMSVLFTAVMSFIEYKNVCGKVGIQGLSGAVQSFEMFRDFGMEISLFQYIIMSYIIRCIFSALLALLALIISKCFSKTSTAQIVTTATIVGIVIII